MWLALRRFCVPAFQAPIRELRDWGVELSLAQPELVPGRPGQLRGCVCTEQEARDLAGMILLGIEVQKPDVLQELDYALALSAPQLVVVPFVGAPR
jgi:hypothetical protein